MKRGKEWSPKKYTSDQIEDVILYLIDESVAAQRTLTRYTGPDEGFFDHVANKMWDAYTYKLIGENTGFINAAVQMAAELDLKLPPKALRLAELYTYTR